MPEERKPKAVIFADIEGYTSLMQSNENNAIQVVEKLKKTLEKIVPDHHGEILQFYGDGSLCTFDSAIMAIHASNALQKAFSENPKIPVRIGVHIGDILFKGSEFYGDGVNIASRIQALGAAGSVLLSEDIFQTVKNQTDFEFQKIGRFDLKNVAEPLTIYALANEGIVVPSIPEARKDPDRSRSILRMPMWVMALIAVMVAAVLVINSLNQKQNEEDTLTYLTPATKALAVLPLTDLMPDADQAYFVEGMHESLIFDLSKIKALNVISRTSIVRYNEMNKSIPEIADELNVDVLIEGSVLRFGDTVRIIVQLIDGKTDHHLWSKQYDRSLGNVLVMMSEVAKDIAGEVEVVLSLEEEELLKGDIVNTQAHELYLKGRFMLNKFQPTAFIEASNYFDQAIEVDSNFALAWAGKAGVSVLMAYWDMKPFSELIPAAQLAAERAIEIDPTMSIAYSALGWVKLMAWEWSDARDAFRTALDLNQNDIDAIHGLGDYLTLIGRKEEGLYLVKRSFSLDPFSPTYHLPVQGHLYMMHRYNEALEALNNFKLLHSEYSIHKWQRLVYWELGQYDESISSYGISYKNDSLALQALNNGNAESGPLGAVRGLAELLEQRYNDGKLKSPVQVASLFAQIRDADKTMEWLEKAYEKHVASLFYVYLYPQYDFLKSDLRFQDLMQRMNLPPHV